MAAEQNQELHAKELEASENTKYSIIALLSRLGASKEKTTLESRKDLWKKYQSDIRKDSNIPEKYTGSSGQNLAMLKYIKDRIKGGEIFDANSYEFSAIEEKREEIKDKGTEERIDLKAEVEKTKWEEMKESGEKRDDRYLTSIKKDLELFEPKYETASEMKADLYDTAHIDGEITEKWAKSPDNAHWIHINAMGRDEAYKRLSEMRLGLDDLKKIIKGNEVSMEDLSKQAGYKDVEEMTDKYNDYQLSCGEYMSWAKEYAHFAKKVEELKKAGADTAEIARNEQYMRSAKSEVEHYRPQMEKDRPGFEKLMTTIKSGKKLIEVLNSKERFFYNKQQDTVETEAPLNPETQKTLDVLSNIFARDSKGPSIENPDDDSKRVMTMLELSKNVFTKDTGYFERHSSFGAAYDDIESRVLDITSSDKTRENLATQLNRYIELALIKAGKTGELSKHKVTAEMIQSGKIDSNLQSIIRIGYIVDLHNTYAIEKARRLELAQEYSKNPQIVELLKQFKQKHPELTEQELRRMGRKIDSRLQAGILLGATEKNGSYGPAAGGFVSFDVGNGYSLSVGLAGILDAETREPIANIVNLGASKKIEITKDTKVTFGLGLSVAPGLGVGTSAVIESPISDTWDMQLGGGIGLDALRLQVGVGGVVGLHKNVERTYENNLEEKYQKAGIADIEKAKNTYEAAMKHPILGKQISETLAVIEREMKTKGQTLSEEYKKTIALEIYDTIRDDIDAQTIADLDPGLITGGGVMISTSILPVVPYITINLGKKVQVIRLLDAASSEVSDEEIKKQLDADLSKNPQATYIDLGKSGRVVMDKDGRNDILMDQTTKFEAAEGNNLELLNKAIGKARVRFEQTKEGILKMHIEGSRNANINVHLDPQLSNTQLIHDAKDFYLNFDLKQNLLVTRKEVRYPFMKEGAYREISIYIKKDAVSETTLEGTEAAFLEKNIGKAIQEVGFKSKLKAGENNILDYQEFLNLQNQGRIDKFEIPSQKAYKDALDKLLKNPIAREQLDAKQEKSRGDLEALTKEFYDGGTKHRALLKKLTTEYNPKLEVDYDKVVDDFENFLKDKKEKPLSPLERTFFRNILVELTFRDVTDRSPKARQALLKHDAEWIKKTFMEYLDTTSYKGNKEAIATIVMEHITKTTFDKDEWKATDPNTTGDLFVSMVGTQHIIGARRSNDYDGSRFKLINSKSFDVRSEGPDGQVARAMLEIISPLDRTSPQAFLRSPLSLKLSKIIPFAFKPEDVDLYLNILNGVNPQSDAKHAEFYGKYVALVEKVRDYEQNSGEKSMDLGAEFGNVRIDLDVSTTVGLFEKCQNFTMMGKENLHFTVPNEHPVFGGAIGETHARVESALQARFRELGIAFGIPTGIGEKVIGPEEPTTSPETTGQVHVEVGDGVRNGQTQTAPQSGGNIDTNANF